MRLGRVKAGYLVSDKNTCRRGLDADFCPLLNQITIALIILIKLPATAFSSIKSLDQLRRAGKVFVVVVIVIIHNSFSVFCLK